MARSLAVGRVAIPQQSNWLANSNAPDTASFTKNACTAPISTVLDAYGTAFARAITEDGTNNNHYLTQFVTMPVGAQCFGSFEVLPGSNQWVLLEVGGGVATAYVNLATLAFGATSGLNGTPTITTLANGWLNVILPFIGGSGGSQGAIVFLSTGNGIASYQGTLGRIGTYIGNCQISVGSPGPRCVTGATPVQTALRAIASGRVAIPQRQNLAIRSDEFDNVNWPPVGVVVTPNQVLSPSTGQLTADMISELSGTSVHVLSQSTGNVFPVPGQKYAASCFLLNGTRQYAVIRPSTTVGFECTFDLVNGTVVNQLNAQGFIAAVIGWPGWFRCWVLFTPNDTTAFGLQVALSATTGQYASYAGDPTKYIYAAGYQLVEANWPGPVTATAGSVVNTGPIRSLP